MSATSVEIELDELDEYLKVENIIEVVFFECRLCGSTQYREEFNHNGIFGPGGRSWRKYCVCEGCSVIFYDPLLFSKSATH